MEYKVKIKITEGLYLIETFFSNTKENLEFFLNQKYENNNTAFEILG